MNQEQLIQLQVIEQEAQQFEQQSQLVQQSLAELQNLISSLEELEKTDKKEIFASLGRGIYIHAEIKDKKLSVEVGNKIFVKKTISETKKIIEEQIEKLNSAREQIEDKIDDLRNEVNQMMKSEKSEERKKDKK
ncbi:MAG: prefoldin subunit alpha [Candidatus Nanoarchaeia archaeon]|nr:prefoldin subunit alpha [Candidatus Nanoarchaeia archaeon]MDD5741741.1 prefoldin subunit alpha [Candidatus Nanoarchaeia archaeon]